MAKNYEEVAMDVIREDWEFRKSQHNASFNQERIARMMGIRLLCLLPQTYIQT